MFPESDKQRLCQVEWYKWGDDAVVFALLYNPVQNMIFLWGDETWEPLPYLFSYWTVDRWYWCQKVKKVCEITFIMAKSADSAWLNHWWSSVAVCCADWASGVSRVNMLALTASNSIYKLQGNMIIYTYMTLFSNFVAKHTSKFWWISLYLMMWLFFIGMFQLHIFWHWGVRNKWYVFY